MDKVFPRVSRVKTSLVLGLQSADKIQLKKGAFLKSKYDFPHNLNFFKKIR